MNPWVQILITIIGAVFASSGLWAYVMVCHNKKDAKTEMLIGLGHDRIVYLGMKYIERGDWITKDEYENLNDYLYKPYAKCGGNGSAERIMKEVNNLRIVANNQAEYERSISYENNKQHV